jgi:hypothetical protein
MNCRRVFSNNSNINYTDYNCRINGDEIYKNILSKGAYVNDRAYSVVNNEISSILDYQTFLKLTRAYLRKLSINRPIHFTAPASINEAKTSFICYKQLLSHLKDCDNCCNCKNISEAYECKEFLNILYPYGNYEENTDGCFQFPTKLHAVHVHNKCESQNKKFLDCACCNDHSKSTKPKITDTKSECDCNKKKSECGCCNKTTCIMVYNNYIVDEIKIKDNCLCDVYNHVPSTKSAYYYNNYCPDSLNHFARECKPCNRFF